MYVVYAVYIRLKSGLKNEFAYALLTKTSDKFNVQWNANNSLCVFEDDAIEFILNCYSLLYKLVLLSVRCMYVF